MALLKIDWNPDARKTRQFGAGLAVFGALLAALARWKGHPEAAARLLAAGAALGVLAAAFPGSAGRWTYRAWMVPAFLVGTVVSNALLAAAYYGLVTPMALFFRLRGRDALRLRRPAGGTYWVELPQPKSPAYFERLF